jgi:hypothetical protein
VAPEEQAAPEPPPSVPVPEPQEEAAPVPEPEVALAPEPEEESAPEPEEVAPPSVSSTPPVSREVAPPPPGKKKRKSRAVGFDALEELEKLRREAIRPKASPSNGRREINRDFQVKLSRDHLARGRRFALVLQLEDEEHQAVDEAKKLYIDVDDLKSPERLLLRLAIAVESTG